VSSDRAVEGDEAWSSTRAVRILGLGWASGVDDVEAARDADGREGWLSPFTFSRDVGELDRMSEYSVD